MYTNLKKHQINLQIQHQVNRFRNNQLIQHRLRNNFQILVKLHLQAQLYSEQLQDLQDWQHLDVVRRKTKNSHLSQESNVTLFKITTQHRKEKLSPTLGITFRKSFQHKTHNIKVFEYLILCVFLILKIFQPTSFYALGKQVFL